MAHYLLFRIDQRLACIASDQVEETLRPMPLEKIPESPQWVVGLSLIRGMAVPVIDPLFLLEDQSLQSLERLITLKVGMGRLVAVQASEVLSIKDINTSSLGALPPLASLAKQRGLESLKALDPGLLAVLESGKLIPEDLWEKIENGNHAGND